VKSRFLRIRAGDCRFFDPDGRVPVDKNSMRRRHQLTRQDDFPLVLSDHAENFEQPDAEPAWEGADMSTRILKPSILGLTAAAIVFAVVLVENPVALFENTEFFANAKAYLVALIAPQDGAREEMPTIQSTAGVQALPPTASRAPASDAPTDNGIAAPLKTADQSQTEIRQAPTEALLGQFQAWAAAQDARAEVRPGQQPLQDAPAQPVQDAQAQPPVHAANSDPVQVDAVHVDPVQDARAEAQPTHEDRPVRRAKNAQAEIRAKQNHRAQNHRAQVRREQNARAQVRPAQDDRAQDQPVQNARPLTFLESIGLRN
jgi:hypothetical protein